MRALPTVVVLVTLFSFHAVAHTEQPAWLVTNEIRIQQRFDLTSKFARLNAAGDSVRRAHPDAYPIDGSTHAELFFPWEVMETFLAVLRADPSEWERFRESYRAAIEGAGWNFEAFWKVIDNSGTDYLALRMHFVEAQKRTDGRGPTGTERDRMRQEVCAARAAILNAAREEFGRENFDRFLYTAVAPKMRMWITDERSASVLTHVEGGCK
jgi:hypothetical protein